jgi:hypothetical protein
VKYRDETVVFEDVSEWKTGLVEFQDFSEDVEGGSIYPQHLRCFSFLFNMHGLYLPHELKPLTPAAEALLAIALERQSR